MSLSFEVQLVILGLVGAGLLLFAYMELRWVRRRGTRVEQRMERDDAYNAVVTLRTIEESLRNQGHDISDASNLVTRADMAYERGAYAEAIRFGDMARQALIESESRGPEKVFDTPDVDEPTGAQDCMSLPDNMVEARFMISKAEGLMPSATDEGVRSEANDLLLSAHGSMDDGDCTEAYCSAVRACKVIEGAVAAEGICPECGAEVSEDDRFCRRCGSSLE